MKYGSSRQRLKLAKDPFIMVAIKGYFSQRELERYIPLNRVTLNRYLGKYGHEKLKGFPERLAMAGYWRYRIYDVDLWLGILKEGDKLGYMQDEKKEKLVDIERAAKILKYDVRYIRRLSQEGSLPCYKTKRKWFYIPTQLEQWMRENDRV